MLNGTLKVGTIPNKVGIRYISSALWYLEDSKIEKGIGLAFAELQHPSVHDEFHLRIEKFLKQPKN